MRIVPIPGIPDYEVSECGDVYRRRSDGSLGVLTPHESRGYLVVHLHGQKYRVHRLVLLTFVGPCPDGMLTRHLNGQRSDNRLENLLYGTPKENGADRSRHHNLVYGDPELVKQWRRIR